MDLHLSTSSGLVRNDKVWINPVWMDPVWMDLIRTDLMCIRHKA